ncbi:hypothetical protein BT69DRAFT_785642 [Atractiella rhizophila]|nr:hypothetical protein BT69DRAFT_785642 [Atractiella rhizophila]
MTETATETAIKKVVQTETMTSVEVVPTTIVKDRTVTMKETDVVTDVETATKTEKEIHTVIETSVYVAPTTVISQWVTTKTVDKTKLVESTVVSTSVADRTVTEEVTKTEVVDSQQTSSYDNGYNNGYGGYNSEYDCTKYVTVCESSSYGKGYSKEICKTYKQYCDSYYGYSSSGCYEKSCGHDGKQAYPMDGCSGYCPSHSSDSSSYGCKGTIVLHPIPL